MFLVKSWPASAGNAKLQPVPNSLPGFETELWKYQLLLVQEPEIRPPQPKRLSCRARIWQCMYRRGLGLSSYSHISTRCPFPNAGQKMQGQQWKGWKGSLLNPGCVLWIGLESIVSGTLLFLVHVRKGVGHGEPPRSTPCSHPQTLLP